MKIELKATGDNGSGKTRCLNKIKPCLENMGLKVSFSPEDEHKLVISGEFSEEKKDEKKQLEEDMESASPEGWKKV